MLNSLINHLFSAPDNSTEENPGAEKRYKLITEGETLADFSVEDILGHSSFY